MATVGPRLAAALGFPEVEDSHEISLNLGALGAGPAALDAVAAVNQDPKPTPEAMGDNDLKNILYINFKPGGLSDAAQAQLTKMTADLELNTNFLSLKAGQLTQKQIDAGKLPSSMDVGDQIKEVPIVLRLLTTTFKTHHGKQCHALNDSSPLLVVVTEALC